MNKKRTKIVGKLGDDNIGAIPQAISPKSEPHVLVYSCRGKRIYYKQNLHYASSLMSSYINVL